MKNMGSKIYKIVSVVLLIAVMVTIFVLSHQEGAESSETSGFVTEILAIVFGDNIPEAIVRTFGHFSEFAALGFLSTNCYYAFKEKRRPVLCAFLSWLYAWTDEIHQIFVDGRAFQISDLLVDLGGIICGIVLIIVIILLTEKIKRHKKSRNHN